VKKLFEEIVPRLKGREGGYTRVYKMGWRQGDGAPLSLVELVTFSHPEEKKSTVKKAKEVLEKVGPKKKGKEEKKEKKEEEKEKGKEKPKEKEKKEKKVKKEVKETAKEKKEKPKKKSEGKTK
jgi:outer membrane biosynthesis protein TonB